MATSSSATLPARSPMRLAGGVDLPLDVAVAGGHDEVHAVDVALQREVDVVPHPAGEAGHRRVQSEVGDPGDGLALAGAGAGAAGLDERDVGGVERPRDLRLVVGCQRDAGRLLAVAQRGVQKLYVTTVEGSSRWMVPEQVRHCRILRVRRAVEFLDQPPRGDLLYPLPCWCSAWLHPSGGTACTLTCGFPHVLC